MIRLEPLAASHAPALQILLENPAIAETTPFPHPYPPDGAREYVEESLRLRWEGTKFVFAVCLPDGTPVGMVLFRDVDLPRQEGELGYWIGRPYWGQGYASAAGEAALAYGFTELGFRLVRAVCLETNQASLRVLARLGFVESGRMLQALPKWPTPRSSLVLSLTREAWHARRSTRS